MLDIEERPWGKWEEYLNERNYRLKRITIYPRKRFSLQKHVKHSEYWVIVEGQGKFTVEHVERQLSEGDYLFVPKGSVHRIENNSPENLIIIEIQLGECLENDIERLEDDWGRT